MNHLRPLYSSAATPGIKPVDRDADAVKSDEPDLPSLLDYTNPDNVISAIIMGKHDAVDPAERTGAFTSDICHSISSGDSTMQVSSASSPIHSSQSSIQSSDSSSFNCALSLNQGSHNSKRALARDRRSQNKMPTNKKCKNPTHVQSLNTA